LGLLVATVLLSAVAFLSRPYLNQQAYNPPLDAAIRILVLVFGLGAVWWRRSRFATMRLQDIVGLAGLSGLLRTLERTTLQLALTAAAIVVFVYCYPTKSSWMRAVRRFSLPIPETPAQP